MKPAETIFVVPTYRLRDVAETVEAFDEHFWSTVLTHIKNNYMRNPLAMDVFNEEICTQLKKED